MHSGRKKSAATLSGVRNLKKIYKNLHRLSSLSIYFIHLSHSLHTLIFPDSFNTINSTQCLTGYSDEIEIIEIFVCAHLLSPAKADRRESCEFCIAFSHRTHRLCKKKTTPKIAKHRELCWIQIRTNALICVSCCVVFNQLCECSRDAFKFMEMAGFPAIKATRLNHDLKSIKRSMQLISSSI